LDFMEHAAEDLLAGIDVADRTGYCQGVLSEAERSGVLALHHLLRELDPNHQNLGLHRVPTYTGDYLWLCDHHYQQYQPNIPDTIASEAASVSQPVTPNGAD
jgi:hypothetical protein